MSDRTTAKWQLALGAALVGYCLVAGLWLLSLDGVGHKWLAGALGACVVINIRTASYWWGKL